MGVLYCWIYVFSSCLRALRKIDSSIGLPSLNKFVTYLLTDYTINCAYITCPMYCDSNVNANFERVIDNLTAFFTLKCIPHMSASVGSPC